MNLDVEKVVREYLDKTIHMSLATTNGVKPWICEVHFVYDDSLNLYFRSLSLRRHSQDIAKNPHVAGNIVKQHALGEYPHAIYFEGRAERMADPAEIKEIFPLFKERLQAGQEIIDEALEPNGHQFYKIGVEHWYAFGKFGGDKGQKYPLKWNGGKR